MNTHFNPPERLLNASGSHLDPSHAQSVNSWLKMQNRGPLTLSGKPGRGKSYIAAAVYNYVKSMPYTTCYFVNISELNQAWLEGFKGQQSNLEILMKLKQADCLVLDDLGIKSPSDGFFDFLYCIIDERSNIPDKYTIYTTNCTCKELEEMYSARIVSRITYGVNLKIEGIDRRKNG